MDKKIFVVILLVFISVTLNVCAAQDIDNSTNVNALSSVDGQALTVENAVLKSSSVIKTQIDIESNTTFDVFGDDFKVRLSDENNSAIPNKKVIFSLNGANYNRYTDDNGVALLKLNLDDGSYNITSRFLGDSNYQASSKTATITIDNTKIVDAGLGNDEIQNIIDNAKEGNVIIFNGDSYDDINLVITKRLTLVSSSNTELSSSSTNPVITIRGGKASLTTVSGFVIKGKGNGILISNADYVTIINNSVSADEDGIIAVDTNYLNITKNSLVKNGKSGIVVVDDNNTYIMSNVISNSGNSGITVSKSNNTYIYYNMINNNKNFGITATNKVNGNDYGEGPQNLNVVANTINSNGYAGIDIDNAGDGVKILGNTINSNSNDGISITIVGNYLIQSNVIYNNKNNGIEFTDEYVQQQSGQDISYNAIYGSRKSLEARDTYYQENGVRLIVGDNWYSDYGFVCPKIKTNGLKLSVSQIGGDYFKATFLDSKGNVASLLPDRTLTYKTSDGNAVNVAISGGTGVFKLEDTSIDSLYSYVDRSERIADYNKDLPDADMSKYSNGQTPTYSYPNIPYASQEGMGEGDGSGDNEGSGQGLHGISPKGNGKSTGNGTVTQRTEPSSTANPIDAVSQSVSSQNVGSSASSSSAGGSQSIAKQIIIDEDEIFKVTGISFIVLLIILTIGFYYRDDIEEMKSKR